MDITWSAVLSTWKTLKRSLMSSSRTVSSMDTPICNDYNYSLAAEIQFFRKKKQTKMYIHHRPESNAS